MLDEFDNTETTETTTTTDTGDPTSAETAETRSPFTGEPEPSADTSGGTASARTAQPELPTQPQPEPEAPAVAKKAAKRAPRKTTRSRKTAAAPPAEGATGTPAGSVAEGAAEAPARLAAEATPEPAAEGGSQAPAEPAAEGGDPVADHPAATTAAAGTAAKKTAKKVAKKTPAKRAPRKAAAKKAATEPEQLPLEEPAEVAEGTHVAEAAAAGAETALHEDLSPAPRAAEPTAHHQDVGVEADRETPEARQETAESREDRPAGPDTPEPGTPASPVAATSVLFKAPEPTPPPRRRKRAVTAEPAETAQPSGTPETAQPDWSEHAAPEAPAAATPAEAPEEPPRDREAEETPPGREDADQDAGEETDLDQGGNRRRRRRGGRRRRRGSGGEDATDESADDSRDDARSEARDETGDETGAGDVEQPADGDEEGASEAGEPSRRRSEGGRGQKGSGQAAADTEDREDGDTSGEGGGSRRRRRRRRSGDDDNGADNGQTTATRARKSRSAEDEITSVSGSTRLEAKKQRRREGREAGRRRAPIVSEAEFLARREAVDRVMVIRQHDDLTQIAVLEDKVLVEHYVARESQTSLIGNVYLGRVQNVLPSMEAAFVDIGKGRNAVLYAGEVNWDALGAGNGPRKIEQVLKSGQPILVQVTKDPVGHKGARLTSQVSLPGRFLVYVPDGTTSGISRKLPDTERNRLKTLLKDIVPDTAGVIVRTAAEGASEDELTRDVERLTARWADIERKVAKGSAPQLLYGEPDLTLKVVRDLFTEDIGKLVVSGDDAWAMVESYVKHVAPDLEERLERYADGDEEGGEQGDVFAAYRIDEQIAKGLDRKVWLPSGGSLIIDRTEAMTVVDVNTGKFTGSGGNLEETVTKNNLEAAEEIVRQLRLRDIGGIIVVDFIDMVLESNRDLVLRRLVECLGRDRTRHQVAEVTSLGLVQMTRKRIGTGLLEAFSETCEHCQGRGLIVHHEPVEQRKRPDDEARRGRRGRARGGDTQDSGPARNGSGRNGSATPGPVRHAPTPADLAAMAKHEPRPAEAEAPTPEPVPIPAAEPVPTSAAPTPTTDEPTPAAPAAATAGPADAEPAASVADLARAGADGELTVAPPSTDVVADAEPELDIEPMEPIQPTQPAEPAAPRLVTSTRRRVARRPAGPPSTPPPYPSGDGAVSPDGSPALAGSKPDSAVPDEAIDSEQPHVPVKKRGRKR